MIDWICTLAADCLACPNSETKLKHLIVVPLENWQRDTATFCAKHIGHEGPLLQTSNGNTHCFLRFDSFSTFSMVYPVTSTVAQASIAAVESGSIFLVFPSLSYTTKKQHFLIYTILTGPRKCESHFAHFGSFFLDQWQSTDSEPATSEVS